MAEGEVLLRGFRICQVMDCIADPTKNRVIAELSDRVDGVFPYLNALLPGAIHNPGANTLTVKRGGRILTFYPHLAVMAKVDGEEDASAQVLWFQELCNDVWSRRSQITPSFQRRQPLGPLDAYLLLPRLNCRDCGEPSCLAFALRLLMGEMATEACPHLEEEAYVEGGRRLRELLS